MTRLTFVFSALLLSLPGGAQGAQSSGGMCEALQLDQHNKTWAIAPLDCAADLQDGCAQVMHELVDCLKAKNIDVITPAALRAAVDEQALKAALGSGDTRHLRKLGDLVPARYLAIGEVSRTGDKVSGAVRVVSIEEGKVVAATRVVLTPSREGAPAAVKTVGQTPDDVVEIGLRRLADRLIEAYSRHADGGARYKKIAVLPFKEATPLVQQKGLGTLVAAELVSRFTREHSLVVVERSRLDAVLKEFEVAQLGLVDERSAPKLGKMVEADAITLGEVSEVGDRFVIHARIVDVETGVTLVAEQASVKAEGLITLASDALVLRSKSGAVFRSLLIPGWGQFYNRQEAKGITFISVVGALGAAAITTQVLSSVAAGQYAAAQPGANFDEIIGRANGFATARTVCLILMGSVWAYNVLDAYLNGATFDSAVSTRAASVAVSPFGVSGRF